MVNGGGAGKCEEIGQSSCAQQNTDRSFYDFLSYKGACTDGKIKSFSRLEAAGIFGLHSH